MVVANRLRNDEVPEECTPKLAERLPAPGQVIHLDPGFWQTPEPYHPARPLESAVSRYEKGKALRVRTAREAHAD